MDYITIASTGNATDFGNLLGLTRGVSGCSNGTRGTLCGGLSSSVIQYITIASTGNSTNFGNLSVARENSAALSGDF